MKPGKFILLALISVSVLLTTGLRADVAADVAALKNLEIGKLCPLFIETPLVRAGEVLAAIVPATGEPWTSAATKLQSGIAGKTGVTLPIVPAEKITDADWSSRNLIVLGNLIASPVYAHEAPADEPFNLQLPADLLARQPMTPAPVMRGGVSFHHGNTFHQSGPNSSTRWRMR